MKEITEQEFENYILDIISGKKSRQQIVKELETDSRTLNNKIQLLSETNPSLYQSFIKKFPYKPKEITTISIRNIVIEFLQNDINMEDLARKHHIGARTLRRKISKLRQSDNPQDKELYELHRIVAYNHSHGRINSSDVEIRIQQLEKEIEGNEQTDFEKKKARIIKN